jgi:hypothetical protein
MRVTGLLDWGLRDVIEGMIERNFGFGPARGGAEGTACPLRPTMALAGTIDRRIGRVVGVDLVGGYFAASCSGAEDGVTRRCIDSMLK